MGITIYENMELAAARKRSLYSTLFTKLSREQTERFRMCFRKSGCMRKDTVPLRLFPRRKAMARNRHAFGSAAGNHAFRRAGGRDGKKGNRQDGKAS